MLEYICLYKLYLELNRFFKLNWVNKRHVTKKRRLRDFDKCSVWKFHWIESSGLILAFHSSAQCENPAKFRRYLSSVSFLSFPILFANRLYFCLSNMQILDSFQYKKIEKIIKIFKVPPNDRLAVCDQQKASRFRSLSPAQKCFKII